jgi:uncharacterized protein YoxC
MDIIQIALIIVLILLSVNLAIVAIYLISTLKEFREVVRKANRVLDNVDTMSGPLSTIAGIFAGVSQSVRAIKDIGSLIDTKKFKEE